MTRESGGAPVALWGYLVPSASLRISPAASDARKPAKLRLRPPSLRSLVLAPNEQGAGYEKRARLQQLWSNWLTPRCEQLR